MYFMMICTWDPCDDREVRTRRVTWNWPEDVEVLYEFYDIQGCRTLYAVRTDAKGLIAAKAAWADILSFEIFPIYPIGPTKERLMNN